MFISSIVLLYDVCIIYIYIRYVCTYIYNIYVSIFPNISIFYLESSCVH